MWNAGLKSGQLLVFSGITPPELYYGWNDGDDGDHTFGMAQIRMYGLKHYIFLVHSACIILQLESNDPGDLGHMLPKLGMFDLKDSPKIPAPLTQST